jgi:formylglycine-generating enzyme required for sulfatase activity
MKNRGYINETRAVNRRAVLLVLFMSFGLLLAQDLAQLRLSGKAERLTGELIDRNVKDANGQVCAGLVVVSDLDGLSYESNNGIVKSTSAAGGQMLFLSADERVVTIWKSGYERLRIILTEAGVKLASGQVWQVKVTGDRKSHDDLPVNIVVDPPGAKITIDGVDRGVQQAQKLSRGSHKVKLALVGYKTIEETINVGDNATLFRYRLEPVDVVAVSFKSNPIGATISIDNADKGETNRAIFLVPGTYHVQLRKAGYVRWEKEINVREDGDNTITAELIRDIAIVKITTDPADARVTLNSVDNSGKSMIDLSPGTYRLEVSKGGFLPVDTSITLRRGEAFTRSYRLVKNTGTLRLTIEPTDVRVLINKEDYSGRSLIELAPGTYRIEVNHDGWKSVSEAVEIQRGGSIEKRFALERRVGKLQFNVVPLEAEVELLQGTTIVQKWTGAKILKGLGVGKYMIVSKLTGYKSSKLEVEIAEEKTAILDIAMEKGADVSGDMILVEGGWFEMGSADGDADEKPVHRVFVSSFYMDRYEVTQEEYERVMGKNPSYFKCPTCPVEQVSWNDAVKYTQKVGKRLPTEAEWEYAVRGGNKNRGDDYSGSYDAGIVAWYNDNAGSKTHPVGGKQPNELGLYDMSGNVWEWCADWYDASYYRSSPRENPKEPDAGQYRVLRGGSWNDDAQIPRVSNRGWSNPSNRDYDLGFRCSQDFK